MSLPVISLIALAIAIIISCVSTLNIGALALGLSLIVGHYIGGMSVADILKGYPTSLLIMLAGTTFLFAIAQVNGTLTKVTKHVMKLAKGRVGMIPIVLFFIATIVSSIGAGGTTTAALMAPTVMVLAGEMRISRLLMAVMVINGTNAGTMSPIVPGGIIAAGIVGKMGVGDLSISMWLNTTLIHFAAGLIAYFLCGGMKLWKENGNLAQQQLLASMTIEPFNRDQKLTLAGIIIFIIGACGFKMDIGLGAFAIASTLALLRVVEEDKAIKAMPWGAILMVTGVTVLIQMMSKVGGMDLFASIMAKVSTPATVNIVAGTLSGVVSAYASTTGVVLPAFLPLAPLLIQKTGAPPADLIPLLNSIVSCGFIVDSSPLSTSGAIFLANAPAEDNKVKLFRNLLVWALSMAVVGSILCWLFFYILRIGA
ncbi:C4-dicarboxylate ABC transporter [Anaerosporomusa subterranea]|uniref:C4-dicarboxylate ABC transporter n=1 Tax=Anaerosporomusa subterranea TaxID=1794912 RepID=A0A154BW01_ANASB|nr:SLC13 family permease [Anaerosporomusa subterranea]KYZ77678.1 C4-dicarboxylate ABC transporter [Anaerosporomusa subterranea]